MPTRRHLYVHPTHGKVQVAVGFSWPAFCFGSLWALARRLYLPFLLMLALEALLWSAAGYAHARGFGGLAWLSLLFVLVCAVVKGICGSGWLEHGLLARGYVLREKHLRN